MVIRDIGLHMSNRVMDYCSEDASLCRGALEAQKGPHVSLTKTDFASVQEYLESSHFVQASAQRALAGRVYILEVLAVAEYECSDIALRYRTMQNRLEETTSRSSGGIPYF